MESPRMPISAWRQQPRRIRLFGRLFYEARMGNEVKINKMALIK